MRVLLNLVVIFRMIGGSIMMMVKRIDGRRLEMIFLIGLGSLFKNLSYVNFVVIVNCWMFEIELIVMIGKIYRMIRVI